MTYGDGRRRDAADVPEFAGLKTKPARVVRYGGLATAALTDSRVRRSPRSFAFQWTGIDQERLGREANKRRS